MIAVEKLVKRFGASEVIRGISLEVARGDVAAIIGPLIGTGLLGYFGPDDASPHIPGASFYAAAAFSLLGLVLAARVFAGMPAKPLSIAKSATD